MSSGSYSFNPISALVTGIGKLIEWLKANQHQRDSAAASFFDKLADTLSVMESKLRRGEIPTEEGNTFRELISAFPDKTKAISLDRNLQPLLSGLSTAAENARVLDFHYLNGSMDQYIANTRQYWLTEMSRLVGQLRGLAEIVRPGQRQ